MHNDDERRTFEGAAALESRIIEEARAEVDMLIADARVRAQQIIEDGERESARIAMESETRAQRDENEILSKHRTQAELEAKKYALKMRHAMIDNVFQAAYRKVWELDPRDDSVIRFIHKTLLQEARGGETVLPSVRHKDAVRIAISKVNDKFAQMGRRPLTMGETVPNITGGFLLDGGTYKKDCSLQAIMEDVRDREIVAVSNLLFPTLHVQRNAAQPQQPVQQQPAQPQQPVQQQQAQSQQSQPAQQPQQPAQQQQAQPQTPAQPQGDSTQGS